MKLTEEQLQQLIDLNDSRVNQILGVNKLEKGKWYKKNNFGDLMFYFSGEFSTEGCNPNYGFSYDGYFSNKIGVYDYEINRYYEATHEEVEQALIKEAKKIGFTYLPNKIKTVDGEIVRGFTRISDSFDLSDGMNVLYLDSAIIFRNGVWAEIVDDKTELKKRNRRN